jgi:hypothetical protein
MARGFDFSLSDEEGDDPAGSVSQSQWSVDPTSDAAGGAAAPGKECVRARDAASCLPMP